jgi:hypothetical protein
MAKSTHQARKPKRWRRRLTALLLLGGSMLGLWIAVHRVPWLGPMVADGLRSVIGVEAVTKLEDIAYDVQDHVNQLWHRDEKPKAYWDVPAKASTPAPADTEAEGCKVPSFAPADVGPFDAKVNAGGDGQWVAITDERRPDAPALMYKTLIHPDARRSWSALSVVAIDLRQARLHMMAGTKEPMTETSEGRDYERAAVVPEEHRTALLAAFNGGFKAQHGHYGIKVDGLTLINPRIRSCWVAMFPDDQLVIGDWDRLKEREPKSLWWRQTPGCMVDRGELHEGLVSELNTHWGATLDGDTVIRRSAIGISKDGKTLYSGIGDHVTARALAQGMRHVGAESVAQLDVNWSYPKFVIFQPRSKGSSELVATKLCDGFEFTENEYVREPSLRDFFYLTKKSDDEIASVVCGEDGKHAAADKQAAAHDG